MLLLTNIMWVEEVSGQLPEQETRVVVKMLPKAKAREVMTFFEELTKDFPEINVVPSRSVSDATYRCQIPRYLGLELGAAGGGSDVCGLQWDLSKAFDRVDWDHLEDLAAIWEIPGRTTEAQHVQLHLAKAAGDGRAD